MMRLGLSLSVLAIGCLVAGGPIAHAQTNATTNVTPSHIAALKEQYRRAPPQPIQNRALVDLGRDLFFDPALSASGKTACGTCHLRSEERRVGKECRSRWSPYH